MVQTPQLTTPIQQPLATPLSNQTGTPTRCIEHGRQSLHDQSRHCQQFLHFLLRHGEIFKTTNQRPGLAKSVTHMDDDSCSMRLLLLIFTVQCPSDMVDHPHSLALPRHACTRERRPCAPAPTRCACCESGSPPKWQHSLRHLMSGAQGMRMSAILRWAVLFLVSIFPLFVHSGIGEDLYNFGRRHLAHLHCSADLGNRLFQKTSPQIDGIFICSL